MPYGTIKVDTITFTDGGVDKSIAISGLAQNPTFTGNITATGTVSGNIIQGGTTVSGLTVTGTTANFASGVYTTQISGATVKVPAGTAGAPTIQIGTGASVAPGLYSAGTDQIGISTGGTSSVVVDSVGQLRLISAGTAAAPAVILGNDINSGFYSAGTDQIAISTAGVERLLLDAVGQLRLISAGTAAAPAIIAGNDTNSGLYSPGADQVAISTAGVERLVVDASGNVGIGITPSVTFDSKGRAIIGALSPRVDENYDLQIQAVGNTELKLQSGATSTSYLAFGTTSDALTTGFAVANTDGALRIRTGNAERVRVDSSGNVGIGLTPTERLDISGGLIRVQNTSAPVAEGDGSAYFGKISGGGEISHTTFVAFRTGSTERARIDSSGRLLLGTSTALGASVSTAADLEVETTGIALSAVRNSADTTGGILVLGKSRGTTAGSLTAVIENDILGSLRFAGADGTTRIPFGASIQCFVDGTPGTNDMPGRLVFNTTADGSASPTERLRLTSTGRMGLATSAPAAIAHIAGNTIISNVDVANASYDSISLSIGGKETGPSGLFFSPDGKQLFTIGNGGDTVDQYALSSAWNISTAVYSTETSVNTQDTSPQDMYIRSDGKKLYMLGTTNDSVFQYTLTVPWSIASLSYDSVSFSVALEETSPAGLFFKPDGLAMYVVGTGNDTVYRYNLSTAWNVSTAVLSTSYSLVGLEANPQAVTFTNDGSRMFVMGNSGDDVNIFNLTTPWDITTATFVTVFSVAAQDLTPAGLFIKPDGSKMYMVGSTNDTIYQYTVPSIAVNVTGTTYLNGSAEITQDLTVDGSVTLRLPGNAASPSVSFNGAGIYNPAANELALSTNSTERLLINSSGNVGIGISAPTAKLHLLTSAGTDCELLIREGTKSNGLSIRQTATESRIQTEATEPLVIAAQNGAGSTSDIRFNTRSNERLRIDAGGRFLLGTTVGAGVSSSTAADFEIETNGIAASFVRNSNDATPPILAFGKSRGTTAGSLTTVNASDKLGGIRFAGADGTTRSSFGASIECEVDGTPGTANMPGRLILSTTPAGSASSTEQWRISSGGTVIYNQPTPAAVDTTATLTVANLTSKIITSSTAAAVTMTLPTGTDMDTGFSGLYNNMAFEWCVINTGATNAVTVQANTAHTIVGSDTVAASNSGRFLSRRTAANTWVTYRLSS